MSSIAPKWACKVFADMRMKNITQNELAKKLGMTKQYVSAILRGKRTPPDAEQRVKAALDEIIKERG